MVTQNKCQQQNVIMRYETSNRVCKQKKKRNTLNENIGKLIKLFETKCFLYVACVPNTQNLQNW